MFDAGELRVEVEDVLPLEEVAKAHEQVEAGHTRGKIVLRVGRGGEREGPKLGSLSYATN